jgi:hypothetical protein
LIVDLTLLGVGEDFVCLGDLFELLGGVRVVFVLVWVLFEGGFAVGLLNLVWRCGGGDGEGVVEFVSATIMCV